MNAPNPLQVANTAQQMARGASRNEAVIFQRVAVVCMGVMAAASVVSMLTPLLRDLHRKHDDENERSRRCR